LLANKASFVSFIQELLIILNMCKTFYSPMMQKIPNFWQNDAQFPNSSGMSRIPKMVKKSPVIV
jgi:hypothetical protein